MNERVCPNCQNLLSTYDHFFCTRCGTKLSKELENKEGSIRVSKSGFLYSKELRTLKERILGKVLIYTASLRAEMLLVLFAFVLLVSMIFLGYKKFKKSILKSFGKTSDQSIIPTVKDTEIIYVNTAYQLNSAVFGTNNFTDYLPLGSSMYGEINDLNLVPERFRGLININSVDSQFGVFIYNIGYGAIFKIINPATLPELIEQNKFGYISFRIMHGFLVGATDDSIFQAIDDVYNQTSVSFSKSPAYITAKTKVPNEGKALIIFTDPVGKNMLINLKRPEMALKIKNLIDQVVQSNYDQLVIK